MGELFVTPHLDWPQRPVLPPPFPDQQLLGPGAMIFAVVHLLNLAADSDTLLFKYPAPNVFVVNYALHFPWMFIFL